VIVEKYGQSRFWDALWPNLTVVVVAAAAGGDDDDDDDDDGDGNADNNVEDDAISVNVVRQQLQLPTCPPLPSKRRDLIGAICRKCHLVIARKSRKRRVLATELGVIGFCIISRRYEFIMRRLTVSDGCCKGLKCELWRGLPEHFHVTLRLGEQTEMLLIKMTDVTASVWMCDITFCTVFV